MLNVKVWIFNCTQWMSNFFTCFFARHGAVWMHVSVSCYKMCETSLNNDSRKGLDARQTAFAELQSEFISLTQIGEVIKELELQEKHVPKRSSSLK